MGQSSDFIRGLAVVHLYILSLVYTDVISFFALEQASNHGWK